MRQGVAKTMKLSHLTGIKTMLHIGIRVWVKRYWVGDIGEVVKAEEMALGCHCLGSDVDNWESSPRAKTSGRC